MPFNKVCLILTLSVLITLLKSVHTNGNNSRRGYLTWDEENGTRVHDLTHAKENGAAVVIPDNYIASITFGNDINTTGWAYMEVQTSAEYDDETQAYNGGYLEGSFTHELIYKHWFNTMHGFCDDRQDMCKRIQDYLDKNQRWVDQMISNHSSTDPYWYQVKLFYLQIQGLSDGYTQTNDNSSQALSLNDIMWLNIQGDLEDLTTAMNPGAPGVGESGRVLGSGSCSALIKLLPNSTDLLVGHDTWSSYQSMLRVVKKYTFPFRTLPGKNDQVPGFTMAFTSYPGITQSGDDFYLLSSGLCTLETTIGNSNDTLWKFVQPVGQVLETVRSVVANRLGHCGRSWSKAFSHYNSGTYNNQWMVVDYKLFKAGTAQAKLPNGLLWVLEQIPGMVQARDQTEVLRTQAYWPSYNVPAFPEIFNRSGVPALVEKYGDWFTYDRTPRALIFRRDQGAVHDLSSMLALMEYNDFQHDPLARCNCTPPYSAENAISARNDLNPANGTYPFGALGHRSHGAIDAKVTSASLFLKLQFLARSGPVHNSNLPPFRWSTVDFGRTTPHVGHPDVWQFPPIIYKWS